MTRSLFLGAIIGAVIAFVWGLVSWTVLPWHGKTLKKIRNEEFVGWVMKENAKKPGIYVIPAMECDKGDNGCKKWAEAAKTGPYVFASVVPKGINSSMTMSMVGGFIIQFATAGLIAYLLLQAGAPSYAGRVVFVTLVGTIAGITAYAPMWNWFHFPLNYTVVGFVDTVVTWFLAGLGMACVVASSKKKA